MKFSGFSLSLVFLLAVLLVGCAKTEHPTLIPSDIPSTAEPTATATLPEPTITNTPQPEPTLTPTPRAVGTFSATIPVNNLNLRSGPGTTYAILNQYPVDTQLSVVSRIPGDEWVRVQMSDGKTGWMSAQLLGLGDQTAYLPMEDVTDSIMVTGRVIDSTGKPVNKVTIAVMQRLAESTLRTDAVTGEDGYWYAYLSKESRGTWEVQVAGVDCASWIFNETCNMTGHFLYNFRFIFQPPPTSPFLFMFQTADAYITGDVTNADGVPVSIRVFAERSDGAYAYVSSNEAGQFSLPVGAGTWRVYSMQYNPILEGESVTIQVEAGVNPDPVHIKSPVKKE